ncbi:hypothetical protein CC86DRAFT_144408 [Ophiobolus disseminans]|uniref:Uncharacterized protein n=1 Tax=Ophiobolus disseminans TaxID=1469910 RepID=A0A6A6ZGI2_9PLEO|nr:hypothetical protein CC86DRAFT_144408 [Ophiobolus disseminans]
MTIEASSTPFIQHIRVKGFLPLYTVENGFRRCDFSGGSLGLYDRSATRQSVIAMSRKDRGRYMDFTFDIKNNNPGVNRGSFIMRGTFIAKDHRASVWHGVSFELDVPDVRNSCKGFSQALCPTKYLPTGFQGSIQFEVTLATDSSTMNTFSVPIEFYVLPEEVPKYILDGLPLKLLQILLLNRFKGYEDSHKGWIKYCMDFLRSQNFRYETLGGKYNYCDAPNSLIETQCYLEHWLAHYESMKDENVKNNKGRQRRVNCYDLAALGQVMLAIGLDATKHKLRMKFLQPYGMIKPTSLIGFPEFKCNNPFFEDGKTDPQYDPRPLWTEDSKLYRSGFFNHAFLAIKVEDEEEKIIDATCGPAIGTLNMVEYVNAAIDRQASLSLKYTEGHRLGGLISRPGSAEDVKDGAGVQRIISPVDVQIYKFGDTPEAGLVRRITTAMNRRNPFPRGDLLPPSIHTDGFTLSLSWFFAPATDTPFPTIDIIAYNSRGGLQQLEYMNREEAFEEAVGASRASIRPITEYVGGYYPNIRRGIMGSDEGSAEPFALWQQGIQGDKGEPYGMVVTVKGFAKEDTRRIVNFLVRVIDEELNDRREVDGDLKVVCHSKDGSVIDHTQPMAVSLYSDFELATSCTIQNEAGAEIQIIGANIATQTGNAVYLEPMFTEGSKSLRFKFAACKAGTDEITISYLTTHLHELQLKVKVKISKDWN